MKFATQYAPNDDKGTSFEGEESLTQTQFADQCDINFMLARLQRGDTSVLRETGLAYADISSLPEDLQSALEVQKNAMEIWDGNPTLKKRFVRPENLIDFLADEGNRDEAVKLGLISAPAVENPVKVEVINPVNPEKSAVSA